MLEIEDFKQNIQEISVEELPNILEHLRKITSGKKDEQQFNRLFLEATLTELSKGLIDLYRIAMERAESENIDYTKQDTVSAFKAAIIDTMRIQLAEHGSKEYEDANIDFWGQSTASAKWVIEEAPDKAHPIPFSIV